MKNRSTPVVAAVVALGVVAGVVYLSMKATGYTSAPSTASSTIPKPLVLRAPAPIVTAHYTDAEFFARPANKLGVVEPPLDEGVVLRDPIELHQLPEQAQTTFAVAQLEEEVEPEPYHRVQLYRNDWLALGGAHIVYRRVKHDRPVCDPDHDDTEQCEDDDVEVSEPGTLGLLLCGLVGLLLVRSTRDESRAA